MIEKFFPDLFVEALKDINIKMLVKRNIKGIILDIDNTIVPSFVLEVDEEILEWIENVKKSGIKVCIVSNAVRRRVEKLSRQLDIPAIHQALKPAKRAFITAVEKMDTTCEQVAVAGDQIFTDIYGGNRLNMYTILVEPITRKDFVFVKIKRLAEKFVLNRYKKIKG